MRTGDILLTGDLYARIRSLPFDSPPNEPLASNRVFMTAGSSPATLEPVGPARIALMSDHLVVSSSGNRETIPVESVSFSGIERNSKWQVTHAGRILEFRFGERGSALQYDDTIRRLNPDIG